LIDECLTPDLCAIAHAAGHEAQHIAYVGLAGLKDWNVVRYAREGDFILVTNNRIDFLKLYAKEPLHAGLVVLIPQVKRDLERRLFRGALEELADHEPINRVLEVDLDGDEARFELYDLPRAD
jgi:predicted nuclease of predicted toxin-antitoxin system